VTGEFELDAPELALLEEACKTRDLIVELRRKVAETGPIIDSNQGPRVHPAAVEARQQALALAKLVTTLGLPKGVVDDLVGGK
jgi:phage terminase small subunit